MGRVTTCLRGSPWSFAACIKSVALYQLHIWDALSRATILSPPAAFAGHAPLTYLPSCEGGDVSSALTMLLKEHLAPVIILWLH